MNVDTEGHLPSVLIQDQTKALLSSQGGFPKFCNLLIGRSADIST